MWEIPALAVLMELHSRAVTKGLGKFELQVLYARAMTRVWEKIGRLKLLPGRQHRRLRHAAPARLPVAGLVRAGDDRGPGPGLPRHLQLPDRHAPRGGGHRHQRARAADGLFRARRQRPRAGRGALPGAGRLAAGLRRQPARHAARHLRLARFPGARARLGDAAGPASASTPAIPSTAARSPSPGGSAASRTRARSCSSSPTASTSTRSSASTGISIGRVRIGYGWGTLLTNDFRGLGPDGRLDPFSIVCKVISADGRPGGEALRQSDEGHGAARRARPLPARVPGRRAGAACRWRCEARAGRAARTFAPPAAD